MSDVSPDYRDKLDLREQIERIDRQREEAQKLYAEGRKLTAEQQKFGAEQQKLMAEQLKLFAEASKLDRDRWLAPWFLLVSLTSGVVVAVISHFWK